MGRIRYIKPGFFTNESLAELPPLTRLLFAGLWTLADCKGRLEDRPKRIKAELFAYDELDVDTALQTLHDAGFITRYTVKSLACISVNEFGKHQRPHPKEQDAKLPEPPKLGPKKQSRGKSRQSREKANMTVTPFTAEPHLNPAVPGFNGDGDLNGDGDSKSVSAEPRCDSTPEAVLTFTTVGPKQIYYLTDKQVSDWVSVYPNLNVSAECHRARVWLDANPTKRKTSAGMPKFLVNWLNRATDSPRSRSKGEAWRPECRARHNGRCQSEDFHERQMDSEFFRANGFRREKAEAS